MPREGQDRLRKPLAKRVLQSEKREVVETWGPRNIKRQGGRTKTKRGLEKNLWGIQEKLRKQNLQSQPKYHFRERGRTNTQHGEVCRVLSINAVNLALVGLEIILRREIRREGRMRKSAGKGINETSTGSLVGEERAQSQKGNKL